MVKENMAKVFISYVQENSTEVARLVKELRGRGINVWLDKDSLLPGVKWKDAIRNAIRDGDFFIACFSEEYYQKDKTYMNEELIIAIEELRTVASNKTWFIPVILNECNVPARNIGAGETLLDLHWVNLYLDWDGGINKITQAILFNELDIEKRELDRFAKWVKKREYGGHDLEQHVDHYIAGERLKEYDSLRRKFVSKFGIDYDPYRNE
jgi:hypothetical protein